MYQREIESLTERVAALGARVVELEDAVNFLLSHSSAPYVRASAEEKVGNEAAVVELLKKGKTMDALKLYREKHPVRLEDAQKAIEELRSKFAG
jgi:hypothetical protein